MSELILDTRFEWANLPTGALIWRTFENNQTVQHHINGCWVRPDRTWMNMERGHGHGGGISNRPKRCTRDGCDSLATKYDENFKVVCEDHKMAVLETLGEPWDFEALAKALRSAHDSLVAGEPVEWTGPHSQWSEILAGSAGVPGAFEPDSLAYHEERGRDPIDVLIMAALQLGMEQGARIIGRNGRR